VSGQLVGEVLDAAEKGQLKALSTTAVAALTVIAEKCNPESQRRDSRQGSVRLGRIQAYLAALGLGHSEKTARRAIRELKDAERIEVVKRGYKAHGSNHATASVYELLPFELRPPKTTEAGEAAWDTQDVRSSASSLGHNGEQLGTNPGAASVTQGVHHDELRMTELRMTGGRARTHARGDPEPPRYCDRHPKGTTERCGPCKDRRIEWEAWRERQPRGIDAKVQAWLNAGGDDEPPPPQDYIDVEFDVEADDGQPPPPTLLPVKANDVASEARPYGRCEVCDTGLNENGDCPQCLPLSDGLACSYEGKDGRCTKPAKKYGLCGQHWAISHWRQSS
jgi:hypothetical protein